MSKVQIPIDSKILHKIYTYAAYANHHFPQSEIAGWGHYNREDGIYKLAPLLDQVAHSTEVITDTTYLLESGYDMKDMTVQWHSHCWMGTKPSGMSGDLGNIKKLGKLMPFVITIIVNLRMEYHCQVDIFKTESFDLEQLTLEAELIPYYDNRKVSADVKRHLKLPPPVPKEEKKEIGQPSYGYWNRESFNQIDMFSDYIPPKQALPPTVVKAILEILDDIPKDKGKLIMFKGGFYYQHVPTMTILTYSEVNGIMINSVPSTFADFCKKIGLKVPDLKKIGTV